MKDYYINKPISPQTIERYITSPKYCSELRKIEAYKFYDIFYEKSKIQDYGVFGHPASHTYKMKMIETLNNALNGTMHDVFFIQNEIKKIGDSPLFGYSIHYFDLSPGVSAHELVKIYKLKAFL